MSKQNILFFIFGFILIGIALLTDYVSPDKSITWTRANSNSPVKIDQPVVVSNNILFAGTVK
jgi:hypothetical protein